MVFKFLFNYALAVFLTLITCVVFSLIMVTVISFVAYDSSYYDIFFDAIFLRSISVLSLIVGFIIYLDMD